MLIANIDPFKIGSRDQISGMREIHDTGFSMQSIFGNFNFDLEFRESSKAIGKPHKFQLFRGQHSEFPA